MGIGSVALKGLNFGASTALPAAAFVGLPAGLAYLNVREGLSGVPKGMIPYNFRQHPLSREIALSRAYRTGGTMLGGLTGLLAAKSLKGKLIAAIAGAAGGAYGGGVARELIHGKAITPEHFGFGAAYKPLTNLKRYAEHTGIGK